jgi:hypothetical protein
MSTQNHLIFCIWNNHIKGANKLIDEGYDLESQDNKGKTALMYACEKNLSQIAIKIIVKGCHLNLQDNRGKTALMYACENNSEEIVNQLIANEYELNLDLQDSKGRTALITACFHNNRNIVNQLIVSDYDLNLDIQDTRGRTALMTACFYDYREILNQLIVCGCNLNIIDNNGKNALMTACYRKLPVIINILIDNGVDPEECDTTGFETIIEPYIEFWHNHKSKIIKVNNPTILWNIDLHKNIFKIINIPRIDNILLRRNLQIKYEIVTCVMFIGLRIYNIEQENYNTQLNTNQQLQVLPSLPDELWIFILKLLKLKLRLTNFSFRGGSNTKSYSEKSIKKNKITDNEIKILQHIYLKNTKLIEDIMSSKNNLNKLLGITDKELNTLHFYFYLIDKNTLYSILNKQNILEDILKKIETKILSSNTYKRRTKILSSNTYKRRTKIPSSNTYKRRTKIPSSNTYKRRTKIPSSNTYKRRTKERKSKMLLK